MNEHEFALFAEGKAHIEELERIYPMNAKLKAFHKRLWMGICKLRRSGALNITDEQFAILAAPQGGGTPKTPPDED
jgi:hypothetical protein